MFETILNRARMQAERKAKEQVLELKERIEAALPQGIKAEATAEGILLSGRNLKRRFAIEPALRWLIAGLR